MSGAFNPNLADDRARATGVAIGAVPTACRPHLES